MKTKIIYWVEYYYKNREFNQGESLAECKTLNEAISEAGEAIRTYYKYDIDNKKENRPTDICINRLMLDEEGNCRDIDSYYISLLNNKFADHHEKGEAENNNIKELEEIKKELMKGNN